MRKKTSVKKRRRRRREKKRRRSTRSKRGRGAATAMTRAGERRRRSDPSTTSRGRRRRVMRSRERGLESGMSDVSWGARDGVLGAAHAWSQSIPAIAYCMMISAPHGRLLLCKNKSIMAPVSNKSTMAPAVSPGSARSPPGRTCNGCHVSVVPGGNGAQGHTPTLAVPNRPGHSQRGRGGACRPTHGSSSSLPSIQP